MFLPPGRVNCNFAQAPKIPNAESLVFCKEVAPNLDSLGCLFTEKVSPVITPEGRTRSGQGLVIESQTLTMSTAHPGPVLFP